MSLRIEYLHRHDRPCARRRILPEALVWRITERADDEVMVGPLGDSPEHGTAPKLPFFAFLIARISVRPLAVMPKASRGLA